MADAPKRPCRYPRCPTLTDDGYCPAHPRPVRRDIDRRESSCKRGYDHRWRAFRKQYLAAHPLCADCLDHGRVTAATDVHHVTKLADAPDRKYDEDNLRSLCGPCHKTRTARGE